MLGNPTEFKSQFFKPIDLLSQSNQIQTKETSTLEHKLNITTLDLPEEIKEALVKPELAGIKVRDLGYEVIPPQGNIVDTFPEELRESLQICLPIFIRYIKKILFTDKFIRHERESKAQTPRQILEKLLKKRFFADKETEQIREQDTQISRRDWRKLQTTEVQKFLENNRISLNSLSTVTTALKILNDKLQTFDYPDIEIIANLINENSQTLVQELIGYADPMTEVKISAKKIALELGLPINKLDQTELLEELAKYNYFPDSDGMFTRKEEMENPSTGYDTLTLEQKLDVVNRTTQLCIQILSLFGYEALKVT